MAYDPAMGNVIVHVLFALLLAWVGGYVGHRFSGPEEPWMVRVPRWLMVLCGYPRRDGLLYPKGVFMQVMATLYIVAMTAILAMDAKATNQPVPNIALVFLFLMGLIGLARFETFMLLHGGRSEGSPNPRRPSRRKGLASVRPRRDRGRTSQ